MTKVLFLIDQLLRGGAERLLLDLLPRLPAQGFAPTLCVLGRKSSFLADYRAAGIEPVVLDAGKWDPRILAQLSEVIAARDIALIDAHLGKSVVTGWWSARRAKIPWVAHDHVGPMWPYFGGGPGQRLQNRFMCHATEWCMNRAEAVVAVSEPGRRWLLRRHPGLAHKVTVVNNGIDLASLRVVRHNRQRYRSEVRQEFSIPAAVPLIFYAASFRPVKGWDVFLEVAERLCRLHPNVHFVGAGEGPLRRSALERIIAQGLQDRIHLPGSRADVPRLMAAADLFLMPTTMESDGIVAKEAMAMGLPVVASDIPVLQDKIAHGKNGFLVPAGCVDSFLATCVRLLEDETMRTLCGHAASACAEEHFGIEACVEKTCRVYRTVLAQQGR